MRVPRFLAGCLAASVALVACDQLPDNLFPTATPGPTPAALEPIDPVKAPPAGAYLFVELWTVVDGDGTLPRLAVDFPDYRFNPATGTLASFNPGRPIALAPASWGFLGHGLSRRGAAGTGAYSSLTEIASLPYSTTLDVFTGRLHSETGGSRIDPEEMRSAPVTLVAAAGDGSLEVEIGGEHTILAPGERWERTVESDVSTGRYNGHYRVTSSLANYGWQARDRIGIDRPVYRSGIGTITVREGREFTLALDANPTTGYEWRLARPPDAAVVQLLGQEYRPDLPRRIGSGGTSLWTFRAAGAGETGVTFEYLRPWESGVPPIRTETFAVRVTAP